MIFDSETRRTIGEKLADYVTIGGEEAWLARSDTHTVEVMRLTPGGLISIATYDDSQIVQSFTLPNLTLAVADIFQV